MLFSPPAKTPSGVVQFRQYVRWVESVTDIGLCPPSDDDSVCRPFHVELATARSVCDRLRDGRIFVSLLHHVLKAAGHHATAAKAEKLLQPCSRPLTPKRKSSEADAIADSAKCLLFVREALAVVLLSDVMQAGLESDGAALSPECRVTCIEQIPTVQQLYSGNFEFVSFVLFHSFHIAVVRERFRLMPSMMRWYSRIAEAYGAPVEGSLSSLVSLPLTRRELEATFRDGVLWLLAMHNMTPAMIDLSTVYKKPITLVETTVNLSFVYSLFDVHGVFAYFANIEDLMHRCNAHFLFMQSFHLYHHFEGLPIRGRDELGDVVFALQKSEAIGTKYQVDHDVRGCLDAAPEQVKGVQVPMRLEAGSERGRHQQPDSAGIERKGANVNGASPRQDKYPMGSSDESRLRDERQRQSASQVTAVSVAKRGVSPRVGSSTPRRSSVRTPTRLFQSPAATRSKASVGYGKPKKVVSSTRQQGQGARGSSPTIVAVTEVSDDDLGRNGHERSTSHHLKGKGPREVARTVVNGTQARSHDIVDSFPCRVATSWNNGVQERLRLGNFWVDCRRRRVDSDGVFLTPDFCDDSGDSDTLFHLPFKALEKIVLGGNSVGLSCKREVPSAPPPYDASCAPAITLFFADGNAAAAFVRCLEQTREAL